MFYSQQPEAMLALQMQPGVKSTRTIINNKQVLNSHKEILLFLLLKWAETMSLPEGRQRGRQTKKPSVLKHKVRSSSPEGRCFWFPCLPKAGLECLQRFLHHLLILLRVWWIGGVHHCQNLWDCNNKHNLCKNNSLWTSKTVSNPENHRSGLW